MNGVIGMSETLYGSGLEFQYVNGKVEIVKDCDEKIAEVEPEEAVDFAIRLLEMIRCCGDILVYAK